MGQRGSNPVTACIKSADRKGGGRKGTDFLRTARETKRIPAFVVLQKLFINELRASRQDANED